MATSMDNKESLIETIRSLKEMARRSTNEHEAASAAATAARLLMKHNLHWEEVEAGGSTQRSDPLVEETHIFTNMDGDPALRRPTWKANLVSRVAKACLCKELFQSGDQFAREPAKFFFLGRKSNAEVAAYLYVYLEREITGLGEKAWMEDREGRGLAFWNSWYAGAVNEVGRRLEEEMNTFKAASEECRALVHNRMREVEDFVKENYPRLGSWRSGATIDQEAYASGAVAGSSIAIRQGIPVHCTGTKLLE